MPSTVKFSFVTGSSSVLVLSPKAAVETAHAVKSPALEAPVPQNPAAVAQQPVAAPSPTPRPARMQQADQGQRYGESGFTGEPINLNVVNADIRDILNYITEQYGINFVIDSSVNTVPVTVNVQDVPWNIALDAVLKANRLGVEVNGNILRVATVDTLSREAESQKVIRDSRLDASALVTEFIRLNYARATGTLSQGGGASGNFAGGVTSSVQPAGFGGMSGGQGGAGARHSVAGRRRQAAGADSAARSAAGA